MSSPRRSREGVEPLEAADNESNGGNDSEMDDDVLELLREPSMSLRSRLLGMRRTEGPRVRVQHDVGNIFGDPVASSQNAAKREMEAIRRRRKLREQTQREIDEIKARSASGVTTPAPVIENEHRIVAMIESHSRAVKMETDARRLHYKPALLFMQPQAWPAPPPPPAEEDHLLLAPLVNSQMRPLGSYFADLVEQFGNVKGAPLPQLGSLLFHRLVYDETACVSGVGNRGNEFEALLTVVRRVGAASRSRRGAFVLPSLVDVLGTYGGVPRYEGINKTFDNVDDAPEKAHIESLDKKVNGEGTKLPDDVSLSVRNLNRAFHVWSARVRAKANLESVLGSWLLVNDSTHDADYAIAIGAVCVDVLLSPFGSHLNKGVGCLLEAIYERVPRRQWPRFCYKFTRTVASCSDRLGLLVDLAEHLLPRRTPRARSVTVDLAFFILWRWRNKATPEAVDEMEAADLESPFTMKHVVDAVKQLPEISKETDATWLQLWGRLLKLVVLDPTVMRSGEVKTMEHFGKVIDHIRKQTSRLPFTSEGRLLPLVLDSMNAAIRGIRSCNISVQHDLPTFRPEDITAPSEAIDIQPGTQARVVPISKKKRAKKHANGKRSASESKLSSVVESPSKKRKSKAILPVDSGMSEKESTHSAENAPKKSTSKKGKSKVATPSERASRRKMSVAGPASGSSSNKRKSKANLPAGSPPKKRNTRVRNSVRNSNPDAPATESGTKSTPVKFPWVQSKSERTPPVESRVKKHNTRASTKSQLTGSDTPVTVTATAAETKKSNKKRNRRSVH